jgi:hypothetical protein
MVSSIVPGSGNLGALGADARLQQGRGARLREDNPNSSSDRVDLSARTLNSARESIRAGVAQLHEALAAGHDAQALLVKVQSLSRTGDQAGLTAALQGFAQRIEAAIGRGASLLAGESVAVEAEPGAAPVALPGVDLRLKAEPGAEDLIVVPAEADVASVGLSQAAQKSLENLQEAMSRLVEAARALEAHQGFLGVAASAGQGDMSADGARLLALQVRQGLEAAGAASIANAEPKAVLSLFRA